MTAHGRAAVRIAAVYATVAAAWAIGSDLAVGRGFGESPTHTFVAVAKDLTFVVVTTALLFVLVRRAGARLSAADVAQRRAADQLEALVRHHPVVVWEVNRGLRLVSIRGGPIEHLGVPIEELAGGSLPELFARFGIDPTEVIDFHERAFAGESVSYEREHAGTVFDTYLEPVRTDGVIDRVVGISFDVTQRARLEAQLRQAHKLEAVGQLAGGIAHDFNNLLTAIGGYAELISLKFPQTSEASSYVDEIRAACERGSRLTGRLLTIGRRQVTRPQVVRLNDLVREMEDMLRRLLGENVELAFHLAETTPRVRADRGQLEQVVLNLVVNARDAMPRGGEIRVSTSVARPAPDAAPHAVLIVEDTGVGMDDETRRRAFEPFFTTKDVGEGTGLGLAIVDGIASQNGGTVRVDTVPGHGSVLRVYFPLTRDEVLERPDQPASTRVQADGKVVLLVEDEQAVRDIARTILEREGYTVIEAADAEAAERALAASATPPDVLVSDVVLPRMSGIDLAGRLLTKQPSLRVLFMSGYPTEAVERHGLPPNTPLLSKPFSSRELVDRVSEVLSA